MYDLYKLYVENLMIELGILYIKVFSISKCIFRECCFYTQFFSTCNLISRTLFILSFVLDFMKAVYFEDHE